jgi:hypothetical protein
MSEMMRLCSPPTFCSFQTVALYLCCCKYYCSWEFMYRPFAAWRINFTVFEMGPYSCIWCKIRKAYADCGLFCRIYLTSIHLHTHTHRHTHIHTQTKKRNSLFMRGRTISMDLLQRDTSSITPYGKPFLYPWVTAPFATFKLILVRISHRS